MVPRETVCVLMSASVNHTDKRASTVCAEDHAIVNLVMHWILAIIIGTQTTAEQ